MIDVQTVKKFKRSYTKHDLITLFKKAVVTSGFATAYHTTCAASLGICSNSPTILVYGSAVVGTTPTCFLAGFVGHFLLQY
jgi:hypothetical protein